MSPIEIFLKESKFDGGVLGVVRHVDDALPEAGPGGGSLWRRFAVRPFPRGPAGILDLAAGRLPLRR